MKTTITLDDDLFNKAKSIAEKQKSPFREVVNEALRIGLQSIEDPISRPYCTHPHKMGLKEGMNLDNIQELLSQIEGDEKR